MNTYNDFKKFEIQLLGEPDKIKMCAVTMVAYHKCLLDNSSPDTHAMFCQEFLKRHCNTTKTFSTLQKIKFRGWF